MSLQRLSLSSSVFAGRIKKYDNYQHNPRTSQRAVVDNSISRKVADVGAIQRTVNDSKKQVVSSSAVGTKELAIGHDNISELSALVKNRFLGDVVKSNPKKKIYQERATTPTQLTKAQEVALHAIKFTPALTRAVIAEQFEDSRVPHSIFRKTKSKLQTAMYSFGILVFIFASTVSVQSMLNNRQAKEQIQVLGEQTVTLDADGVAEGTGSEPSEVVPSAQAMANYRVDPEAPRYLRIPSLQVFARIKSLGVDKSGAVAAPTNLNDVGWYNGSAKPGNEIGSSLLQGHVSGWTAPGVFKKLNKLAVGTRLEVEKGSGEKVMYEVTKSESIPLDQIDMSKLLSAEVAGEHDIKLITCAGKYDSSTKEYSERFVVYAKVLR